MRVREREKEKGKGRDREKFVFAHTRTTAGVHYASPLQYKSMWLKVSAKGRQFVHLIGWGRNDRHILMGLILVLDSVRACVIDCA